MPEGNHFSTNQDVTRFGRIGNYVNEHRIRAAGVAVVGLMSLAGANLVFGGDNDNTAGAGNNEADANEHIATADELAELLTVDTVTADCVEIVQSSTGGELVAVDEDTTLVRQDVGALKPVGVDGGRFWSDAISTPLTELENKDEAFLQIQARICEDPLLGATLANQFANMQIGDTKVVDLNEWLAPYQGDAAEINDQAGEFVTFGSGDAIVSDEEREAAIDKNQHYQELAELLNTMLERFHNTGRDTRMTTLNYHLTADGLVVAQDELPEVELNPDQYNADAIWLALTRKSGGCFVQIGFNVGDVRPVLTEEVCEVPEDEVPEDTVPGTTPEGTTPEGTTPEGTTPTTPPETTPETTPTTNPDKEPEPTPGPGNPGTTQPAPEGEPDTPPTTVTTRPPATSSTTVATVPETVPPTVTLPQPTVPR